MELDKDFREFVALLNANNMKNSLRPLRFINYKISLAIFAFK